MVVVAGMRGHVLVVVLDLLQVVSEVGLAEGVLLLYEVHG